MKRPDHRRASSAWTALVIAGLAVTDRAAAAPACPPRLAVTQAPSRVPAGFKALRNGDTVSADLGVPALHGLASIAFSDGPPDQMAWLAPDRSAARSQEWSFVPSAGRAAWFSCGYLATDVILSAPLPPTTRACVVSLDPATSPPTPTRIACR